ncbi:MAG: sulfatase-like hydrolase/transferase [Pseudomonadales bacterium]|nr:sulfatase-like hydrolase/transferase [Pseudomonadales bacterium]MDP6472686.1 sulfatase-like hydrolase/transferase [Pseudomonadales bacterium]MDP6827898.1 sulfatase-like hydrolase/transferase [Pseudomonadales bacterium]MDP6972706.1 sulfatase-like hydrolase/transferase [Pseudomonadales bacterium]
MNVVLRIGGTLVIAAALSACSEPARQGQDVVEDERPNLLLIVVDDLGYTDLGSFGGEIATPNLDGLARSGVRLTNFHSSASCAPTRAMLMSGTDNHLAGMGTQGSLRTPGQADSPAYQNRLSADVDSLAAVLGSLGYRTYMTGKWHLGSDEGYLPNARGFDRSLALMPGGAGHFDHTPLVEALQSADWRLDDAPFTLPESFYSTTDLTDWMMRFVADGGEQDTRAPFFAYLAYTAPHWPIQAPDALLEKYRGAYSMGYDELLEARMRGAAAAGVVAPAAQPVRHTEGVPVWVSLSEDEKAGFVARMGAYAAMVDSIDQNVGRLLTYLEESDHLANTVVVFMSDNGAEGHAMEYLPSLAGWVEQTFDNTPASIGTRRSYVTIGEGWARATAAPFRLSKARVSEGGIRVPAFVHLPGEVRGSIDDAYMTVMDLAPTFVEIAGGEPRKQHRGRSLLSRWRGGSAPVYDEEDVIAFEVYGRRAVQRGRYKALLMEPPFGTGDWQLYDLRVDTGEQSDLSAELPDLRSELIELWEAYADEVGVILPETPVIY